MNKNLRKCFVSTIMLPCSLLATTSKASLIDYEYDVVFGKDAFNFSINNTLDSKILGFKVYLDGNIINNVSLNLLAPAWDIDIVQPFSTTSQLGYIFVEATSSMWGVDPGVEDKLVVSVTGNVSGYINPENIPFDFEIINPFTMEVVDSGQTPTAVPLPAAVWLFGTGVLGLIGVARRKKAT